MTTDYADRARPDHRAPERSSIAQHGHLDKPGGSSRSRSERPARTEVGSSSLLLSRLSGRVAMASGPVTRRVPRVSGLARHPALWRMVGTVRAALAVRPSVRFVVGELRGGLRRYRTRTGSVVMVRHRSRDVALINEIFGHLHAYEPPPELQGDLAGPLQILDLGGNIGMFGVFALERWAVQRIRSVEPDPANASVLAAVIAANRAEDRWTLTRAAASNRPGTMRFLSGRLTESRQALEHEPGIEVDAIDTFAMAGHVDLLKIDIGAASGRS